MCGIVGALAFDKFDSKAQEKIRQESIIYITTQLLQETVDRGKDATGINLLWADGMYTGLKMGIAAPDFIARYGETEKDYDGLLKLWREYPKKMQIYLGHCRKSSVGNSYDNKNNHPIQVGDIMMVHNGTLTNHEVIFDKLGCKRDGEVDSEAIARLLHHYTKNGTEPFTPEVLKATTDRLEGTYSVLAVSGNNPYQVAQFRDGKPAEAVLVKPLKTVFLASEKKFLERVLFEYNKYGKLFNTGPNKLPYLKKADVEFKMLIDDSCSVWDLTVPIDDKTELGDLYDFHKTTMRTQKPDEWKSSGAGTIYGNRNSSYNTGAQTTRKSEVNSSSKSKDDGDDDKCGLLWSKSLDKYKTQSGIGNTKEMGAVEIDTDSGKVTSIENVDEGIGDLKQVGAKEVENLIDSAAEVDELKIDKTETAINDVKKSKDSLSGDQSSVSDTDVETQEVDMTPEDPEAIKAAEEFVSKGFLKYESDEEVLDALEVKNIVTLSNLPLVALANRIKKFIFKTGFAAGYAYHKSLKKEKVTIEKFALARKLLKEKNELKQKAAKAEKRIALLKFFMRIMGKTLGSFQDSGLTWNKIAPIIDRAITEVMGNHKNLNHLGIEEAFTAGELRMVPMFKKIKEKVDEVISKEE